MLMVYLIGNYNIFWLIQAHQIWLTLQHTKAYFIEKSIVFRPSRHQFKDTLLRGKGRESKSGLLDKPVRKQVSSFYANVSDLTKSVSVKDSSECGFFDWLLQVMLLGQTFDAKVSDLAINVSVKDSRECGFFIGGCKSCYPAKHLQRIRQTSFNAKNFHLINRKDQY